MKYGCMLYILDDVDGNFNLLNRFIDRKIRRNCKLRDMAASWRACGNEFDVAILQCGDFGFFGPDYDRNAGAKGIIRNKMDFCKNGRVRIFWCHGDKDNHATLAELVCEDHFDELHQVDPGIVACDCASIYFSIRMKAVLRLS